MGIILNNLLDNAIEALPCFRQPFNVRHMVLHLMAHLPDAAIKILRLIANVVNGLLIVRIDTDAFVLFDEKPDLLWKIPVIAVLIFAGEAALIYFWQRYSVLIIPNKQIPNRTSQLPCSDSFPVGNYPA